MVTFDGASEGDREDGIEHNSVKYVLAQLQHVVKSDGGTAPFISQGF